MKTKTALKRGTKRWMPLAVIAASGCFIGAQTYAQSSQTQQQGQQAQQSEQQNQAQTERRSQQQDQAQSAESGQQQDQAKRQQSASASEQSAREQLQMEGLERQKIEELAQDGFQRQEVEQALQEAYKRQGIEEQRAKQQAQQVAQRVASETQSSQSYAQREEQQRQQRDSQSSAKQQFEEMAPEGAEIKDSARFVLNEEELNVQKRQVPVGGIVLRKKVTRDDVNETVELRSEDIEIVRLTPEEAEQRSSGEYESGFGESFQEGEIFIPLMREEAVAEKEVETREIVRADTNVETRQKEFDETLRREEVEIQRVEGQQASRQQRESQQGQQARTQQRESQQAQQARTQQNQQSATQQARQSSDPQAQKLEREIRQHLREGEMALSQQEVNKIEIQIEDNKARLSGTVSDEQVKKQIEDHVKSLPEIDEVENRLKTQES